MYFRSFIAAVAIALNVCMLFSHEANIVELVHRVVQEWLLLELVERPLGQVVDLPLGRVAHPHIIQLAVLFDGLLIAGTGKQFFVTILLTFQNFSRLLAF